MREDSPQKTKAGTDTNRLSEIVADAIDEATEKARTAPQPPAEVPPPPRKRGAPATPWVSTNRDPGMPFSGRKQ